MPEVAVSKISFSNRADFALQLVNALQAAGATPAGAQILAAHVAVSTGWGKSVDNYRIAGIKADETWRASKPYTVAEGCECKAGLPDNGDSSCACSSGYGQQYSTSYWRAYNNLTEAAADFLSLLSSSRYASALALAQAGNTGYFAAVGQAGWYTADTATVSKAGIAALEEIRRYLGDGGGIEGLVLLGVGAYFVYRLLA